KPGAEAPASNVWPQSPRYISPTSASRIISKLSPVVSTVGGIVNEDASNITNIASALGLTAVQLHGHESPEFCERLGPIKKIKAIRVGQDFDLSVIERFPVDMILLDSNIAGSYGGTGQRFDWRLAIEAKRFARIMLAGGL